MKYYIYQHIYSDKRDFQILNENELAKIGFQQSEVKTRGGSFIINYDKCTLGVRQCNSQNEAKENLAFILKENQGSIKYFKSLEEYKASFS